jgi:hypothetical protein
MKKFIFASTLLVFSGTANAGTLFENYVPMLGIDYKWTKAKIKTDWNYMFAESFPGVSLYASMKFMENLGIELGYDMTARKGKDRGLSSGDMVAGSSVPVGVGSDYGFHTSLRFAGAHADLMGILPVDSNLEVFFSIGLGKVKPTIFIKRLGQTNNSAAFDEAVLSIRGQHHRVNRLGIGANWAITESVGFRAKVLWEGIPAILLKDNVSVGVQPLTVLQPWIKGYSMAFGFFMKY